MALPSGTNLYGTNLYGYAKQNPLNAVDPSGTICNNPLTCDTQYKICQAACDFKWGVCMAAATSFYQELLCDIKEGMCFTLCEINFFACEAFQSGFPAVIAALTLAAAIAKYGRPFIDSLLLAGQASLRVVNGVIMIILYPVGLLTPENNGPVYA